jgi:hypothetical protein
MIELKRFISITFSLGLFLSSPDQYKLKSPINIQFSVVEILMELNQLVKFIRLGP